MAALSARYAAALMEVCEEHEALEESLEQAELLLGALRDEECQRLLTHPFITKKEKQTFLSDVFSNSLNQDLMGFLMLTVEKKREEHILSILEVFLDNGNQRRGKTTAKVVSAAPLSAQQIEKIRETLADKLHKRVEIQASVNPELIGGLYIYVDGYMIDRTIRKQFNDMRDSIKGGGGEHGH